MFHLDMGEVGAPTGGAPFCLPTLPFGSGGCFLEKNFLRDSLGILKGPLSRCVVGGGPLTVLVEVGYSFMDIPFPSLMCLRAVFVPK